MIATEKIWLVIPYEELPSAKVAAKKLPNGEHALSFDQALKLWFAKPGTDLSSIEKWLPNPMIPSLTESDPRTEFAQVLTEAGFELEGLPEMDGHLHRVKTTEDKSGQKTGAYTGYLDGIPAGWYQDHRIHGEPIKWKSTASSGVNKTAQHHLRAQAAQRKQTREAEQARHYEHHARRVRQLWALLPDADASHPYLQKKGITLTQGIKQDKQGRLVIPLRNAEGEIRTLQRIAPNGFKSLKKGAQKSGCFFLAGGELKARQPLLYAEGYATAASISQATGSPVVMAVDAGNLPTVAQSLATLYPDKDHLFLADDDRKNTNNKGLEKAQEAAELTQGTVVLPVFNEEEKKQNLTDFNDLHQSQGSSVVKSQITPYLKALMKKRVPVADLSPKKSGGRPGSPKKMKNDRPHESDDQAVQVKADETAHFNLQNGINIEPLRAPEGGKKAPQVNPVDLDALLRDITHRYENGTVVYFHQGERAFVDHGHRIIMASPQASQDSTRVLAALLVAKQHYHGKIELTGSDTFKQKALELIAEHRLEVIFKNPHQQNQLDEILKRFHQKKEDASPSEQDINAILKEGDTQAATGVKKSATDKPESPSEAFLTGKLLENRAAPYQFNAEKGLSYFLRIRTRTGEQVIWGKELKQALADSGMKTGDMIHLRFLGKSPLTLNIPVKDDKGNIIRWEKKEGHRHQWEITSAINPRLLVEDEKDAFSPSTLMAYDRASFDKIQQSVLKNIGMTLPLPSSKSSLLWLQPDGKGTSKTGNPETVSLPPPHSDAGGALMTAYSSDGKLKLHLAQGNGEHVQGTVYFQREYRHVLGVLCQKTTGEPYLRLNIVDDLEARPIGYGHAVNSASRNANTFFFLLEGEKETVKAHLDPCEKISAEWRQKLGFREHNISLSSSEKPDKKLTSDVMV